MASSPVKRKTSKGSQVRINILKYVISPLRNANASKGALHIELNIIYFIFEINTPISCLLIFR